MKLNNTTVDARYNETIVVPRGETDYIFTLRPLTKDDHDFFKKSCPKPKPPVFTKPGGKSEKDFDNADYQEGIKKWASLQNAYLFYRSISATDGLEWDTVKESDPETWDNIEKELIESGFVEMEVVSLFNAVVSVNGLDPSKIEEATKSFLATRAVGDL